MSEFCEIIDEDATLDIDLKEINDFFEKYIDIRNKKIDLPMAENAIIGKPDENV